MSGLDERRPARPARHAAPSLSGARRRFLLVVAVLVALASIPSLAVMLAGAASLVRPPAARSPFVAAGPDGPVQVDPGGQRGLGTRPPLTVEPARSVPPRRRPTTAARPARPAPMPEAAGGCTAAASPLPGTPSAEPSSVPADEPEPSPVPERSADGTELDLGLFRLRLR